MALISKASLLMVPSTYEAGTLYNVLPSGNRAPDSTDQNSGYDQTRADFTFDRGSNAAATRVNADGLIEKYRENVALYSNDFSQWVLTRVAVSSSATPNPLDGSLNAQNVTPTAVFGTHRFLRLNESGADNSVNNWSIYAKANGYNFITIVENGNTGYSVSFNLSTGEVATETNAFGSIESMGNGWYRCSMFHNVSTTPRFDVYIAPTDTINSYTADGVSGVTFFGAQAELGLVATDYLDSGATTGKAGVLIDLPRINYDANGENGALLLEPSRLQKTEYSEYFEGWNRVNSNVAVLNANTYTSPEGVDNAYKVTFTEGGGQSQIYKVLNGFTIGTKYTQSIYVKYISGSGENFQIVKSFGTAGVRCTFTNNGTDLSVIAVGGTQADDFGKEPLANGWFRIWFTYASNAGDWEINISRNTGSGSDVYAIYGHQIEAGSYVSSYIPNHGESGGVTRAADSCSVTGVSDVIGQTEGTLFMDVNLSARDSFTYFALAPNLGSTSSYIGIGITATAFSFEVINSGVQVAYNYSNSSTGNFKIAFAYKANDFVGYVNGTQVMTDTSGSVPACSQIGLNVYDKDQPLLYKQATLFNERLTNSELATLTTL